MPAGPLYMSDPLRSPASLLSEMCMLHPNEEPLNEANKPAAINICFQANPVLPQSANIKNSQKLQIKCKLSTPPQAPESGSPERGPRGVRFTCIANNPHKATLGCTDRALESSKPFGRWVLGPETAHDWGGPEVFPICVPFT